MSDTHDEIYKPCYGCGSNDVCHFLMLMSVRTNISITLCDDCHKYNLDEIKNKLAKEQWQNEIIEDVLNE